MAVNNLWFLYRQGSLDTPEQLLHWYEQRFKNDRNVFYLVVLALFIGDPSLWFDITHLDLIWVLTRLMIVVAVIALLIYSYFNNDIMWGYMTRRDEKIFDRLEDLAEIPVRVELASEFRYRKLLLGENDLVIVISQSGETADTLAALREAKEHGAKTLAVVNVVGSTIAREAQHVLYTLAGPEIAVATTKAYSAQLAAMYVLAVEMARVKGKIDQEGYEYYIRELLALPDKMKRVLEDRDRIQWFAAKYAHAHDIFFIGREGDLLYPF